MVLVLFILLETNLLLSKLNRSAFSGLFCVNVVYFLVVSIQLGVLLSQGFQLVDDLTIDDVNPCNSVYVSVSSLLTARDVVSTLLTLQFILLFMRLVVAKKLFCVAWSRALAACSTIAASLLPVLWMFCTSLCVLAVMCVPLL